MEDIEELKRKLQSLEKELTSAKQRNSELERAKGAPGAGEETVISVSEFEETLRRLVQRTAMIVQAEKCVIMVRDRETDDLVARSPAFGMTDTEVLTYRVPIEDSLDGEVFTSGAPAIFTNTDDAPGKTKALLGDLRIRNGVTVPLIVDRRDDQNHIVDRLNIGVLHCFNKRYGGDFIQEDVSLLERLSRNAAAVIANAQIFQDLVEEKQKLVHTLESLTAGLLLVNQRGRIGQMNAAARAIFGIKETENPIGRPYEESIKHEACVAIVKRCLAEGIQPTADVPEEGAKKPDEISITDADEEEFIYQVHAANVHDDANAPVGTVFIFNDITDLRNVERMKTEFVSIVSHELRTPLTPMKGFVRTLLDDENEEWYDLATRREFYTIIDENVDRLARLINDLLNVSRIERMGVAGVEMNWEDNVGLRKATEEVLATQRGRTDKHTFVIDFDPEDIVLESDPDKIQNILQNFVSNAIKYSPDGGEVRIIARLKPADDEFPYDSVVIGVKDQGMGIPESALKKLGEKFYRVNNTGTRKAGGTGIGLFLVRALIAAHKGTMNVESEMDKGSTFWIRLPLRQPEPEKTEEEEPATA